jgi:hypothetical protein
MIKVALKHWIYEQCISVLFRKIHSNFIGQCYKNKIFKVGDRFELIVAEYDNQRIYYHYDCIIMEILKEAGKLKIKCQKFEGSANTHVHREHDTESICNVENIIKIIK